MATSIQVIHIEKRESIPSGLNRHITRQQFVTEGDTRKVEVWVPDNADPKKTKGNIELISRETENEDGITYEMTLQQAVDKRIREADIRPRIGQVTSLEMIFSGSHDRMAAMSRKELKNWADDTVKWAKETWGEENVVSASLHVDEKTPHIHMIVVPIVTGQSRRTSYQQNKGKSKKQYKIDHTKSRLCVNEVYTTGKLYAYHDSYAKEVSSKYGMERGVRAEPGSKKKHTNSIEYNRMLAAQAAEQQALVAELTADYDEKKTTYQKDIQQLQEKQTSLSTALDEEQDKLTKAKSKTQKAEKESEEAEKKLAELNSRKTEIEKEITKLQGDKDTLSTAVETEKGKLEEAESKTKKAKERLSSQEETITKNSGIINKQVADFNARKEELAKTRTEIDSNQEYLEDLKNIKDEIAGKEQELQALSSLGLLKMIMDIPKIIIAEIQKRIKGYWKGEVTSYEEVQYTVGDGPDEDFAKINIKNGDHEYFIEVREETGHVYLNGASQAYKKDRESGDVMVMPELAEFFRTELTPDAKQCVESLYKKTTKAETVWQSKQIFGAAKIIKNAEREYTLKTWDRDFRKWVKVADCVGYSVKSDSTYDYITVTLANGKKEYYNQFGNPLTEKQRRRQGLGGPNTGGGQSM
ncbi:MAG: plasmid recombination protein [Fibrobacter sp.]|nr:plasmid recombination protein [Fibrobacter sp.]